MSQDSTSVLEELLLTEVLLAALEDCVDDAELDAPALDVEVLDTEELAWLALLLEDEDSPLPQPESTIDIESTASAALKHLNTGRLNRMVVA